MNKSNASQGFKREIRIIPSWNWFSRHWDNHSQLQIAVPSDVRHVVKCDALRSLEACNTARAWGIAMHREEHRRGKWSQKISQSMAKNGSNVHNGNQPPVHNPSQCQLFDGYLTLKKPPPRCQSRWFQGSWPWQSGAASQACSRRWWTAAKSGQWPRKKCLFLWAFMVI